MPIAIKHYIEMEPMDDNVALPLINIEIHPTGAIYEMEPGGSHNVVTKRPTAHELMDFIEYIQTAIKIGNQAVEAHNGFPLTTE